MSPQSTSPSASVSASSSSLSSSFFSSSSSSQTSLSHEKLSKAASSSSSLSSSASSVKSAAGSSSWRKPRSDKKGSLWGMSTGSGVARGLMASSSFFLDFAPPGITRPSTKGTPDVVKKAEGKAKALEPSLPRRALTSPTPPPTNMLPNSVTPPQRTSSILHSSPLCPDISSEPCTLDYSESLSSSPNLSLSSVTRPPTLSRRTTEASDDSSTPRPCTPTHSGDFDCEDTETTPQDEIENDIVESAERQRRRIDPEPMSPHDLRVEFLKPPVQEFDDYTQEQELVRLHKIGLVTEEDLSQLVTMKLNCESSYATETQISLYKRLRWNVIKTAWNNSVD